MSTPLRVSLNRDSVIAMTSTQQSRQAVAAEVRAALARAGRRQADLAREVGISRAALSRKMRGEGAFYVEEIVAIADALGIDAGRLVATATAATAAA